MVILSVTRISPKLSSCFPFKLPYSISTTHLSHPTRRERKQTLPQLQPEVQPWWLLPCKSSLAMQRTCRRTGSGVSGCLVFQRWAGRAVLWSYQSLYNIQHAVAAAGQNVLLPLVLKYSLLSVNRSRETNGFPQLNVLKSNPGFG